MCILQPPELAIAFSDTLQHRVPRLVAPHVWLARPVPSAKIIIHMESATVTTLEDGVIAKSTPETACPIPCATIVADAQARVIGGGHGADDPGLEIPHHISLGFWGVLVKVIHCSSLKKQNCCFNTSGDASLNNRFLA